MLSKNMQQLKDWKEQWDNGDTKFVPELLEMARKLVLHDDIRNFLKENLEEAESEVNGKR